MKNSKMVLATARAGVVAAVAALIAISGPVWAGGHGGAKQPGDIVAVASGAGDFNTLIAAAQAADLVGALQGDGPLTVFAPTDAAFAKLPEGTVESLLKPENQAQLQAILDF